MGFLDKLVQATIQDFAIHASMDKSGKPDSYRAAGIAFGVSGDLSDSDLANLGAVGAFDEGEDELDKFF